MKIEFYICLSAAICMIISAFTFEGNYFFRIATCVFLGFLIARLGRDK